MPLVSVFVGCYNHSRFVLEALESVRSQTYPSIELIIWDDRSNDESPELIRSWISDHSMECVFIEHAVNRGLCKSLNEALALASGKYIAMVSADDLWMPERIARQVEILENAASNVGVVYSDAFQIDEAGKTLPGMFIESNRKFEHPPTGSLFDVLWEGNFIPAMATMIRRECFTHVGNYDEDLSFEDWDMWLRISRTHQYFYDTIPLAKYRIVSTSMIRKMPHVIIESTELFKIKYLYRGWLNPDQERSVWVGAVENGRLHSFFSERIAEIQVLSKFLLEAEEKNKVLVQYVTTRDQEIAARDRQIADRDQLMAAREQEIADVKHRLGVSIASIQNLERTVDSAKRWQKSWLKRVFHRWRP